MVFDAPAGKPKENLLLEPDGKIDPKTGDEVFWALLKKQAKFALPERVGTQSITVGDWKLVVNYDKTTTYKLYHLPSDPQAKKDLAPQLDTHVLRMRGRLERQEAIADKATMRKEAGK